MKDKKKIIFNAVFLILCFRMPITEAVQQLEAALLASIQKLPPASKGTKHRT